MGRGGGGLKVDVDSAVNKLNVGSGRVSLCHKKVWLERWQFCKRVLYQKGRLKSAIVREVIKGVTKKMHQKVVWR